MKVAFMKTKPLSLVGMQALLLDMDGVLIDSLGLDIKVCGQLFSSCLGREVVFPPQVIRDHFALAPEDFIPALFRFITQGNPEGLAVPEGLLNDYNRLRRTTPFTLLPGVRALLREARTQGLKVAVVSNNPQRDVEAILEQSGLGGNLFDLIVGNDLVVGGKPLGKKPEPDCYRHACQTFDVQPPQAIVVEDSLLGCQAGLAAGCQVLGVGTGSASRGDFEAMSPGPSWFLDDLSRLSLSSPERTS